MAYAADKPTQPLQVAQTNQPNPWWILAVLCLSLVLVVAANSGVNVALPTLVRAIGATQTQLQWIVDAYAIAFAGFLLPAGALGDRFGRKRALQLGLVVFAGASIWASFASGAGTVIAARGVMGLGAAFIMPSTLSLITVVFPPQTRGRAIAIWAGFAGAGAAIGPLLSGLILERFSWAGVFWINVPIVLVALVAGAFLLPASKDSQQRPLDGVGSLLSIAGLSTALYAIIEAPNHGWFSPLTLGSFLVGSALLGAFYYWETHTDDPMIDFSWFRIQAFAVGTATLSLAFFAFLGVIFLVTQYFQFVLGFSPFVAALAQLPMPAALLIVAPNSARLVERFGPRITITGGMFTLFLGLAWLALITSPQTVYPLVVPGLLLIGTGIASSSAPATTLVLTSLPADKAGVGSAVNDLTRVIGVATGVAILGTVLASIYQSGIASAGLPADLVAPAQESIGAALELARQTTTDAGATLADVARQSFTNGFRGSLAAAAVVALIAMVIVFRYGPSQTPNGVGRGH